MAFFWNFSLTSNYLHPLLVVDEDDNGIFRLERVKQVTVDMVKQCMSYSTTVVRI